MTRAIRSEVQKIRVHYHHSLFLISRELWLSLLLAFSVFKGRVQKDIVENSTKGGGLETLDFACLATLFWGRENKVRTGAGMYST